MMQGTPNSKQSPRNQQLFELLRGLVDSFMSAFDKPFSSDYGSWHDRVKAIMKGDPELCAKILLERPDLEEEKLSRCLVNTEKFLESVLREDVCRNRSIVFEK